MPTRKSKRKLSKRATPAPRRKKSPRPAPIGPAFEQLVAVMARLRAPNGCPWDREQTHATLRTYLIEEAYEVLDALDSTDDAKFAEELGDLLLQVLFHAQIANEEGRFNITDVINEIHSKMIRRHPHVFGNKRAKDAAEVLRNWEAIKAQERATSAAKSTPPIAQGDPARRKDIKEAKDIKDGKKRNEAAASSSSTSSTSLLDGVPRTLPALLEALQLTRKASRIGFDWYNLEGIFAKLNEETHELRQALTQSTQPVAQGESASPAVFASRTQPAQGENEGGSSGPVALAQDRPALNEGTEGRSFSSDNKPRNKKGASAPEEPVSAVLSSASSTSSASLTSNSSTIESEVGDILFVAVNLARFLNLDPEIALKKTNAKFSARFREMERLAHAQGTTLAQIPRPQMESLWDQAKLSERSESHPSK